jgi:hypothetical protein
LGSKVCAKTFDFPRKGVLITNFGAARGEESIEKDELRAERKQGDNWSVQFRLLSCSNPHKVE